MFNKVDKKLLIVGAGAWGSSLAIAASKNCKEVLLWGADTQAILEMAATRINKQYLPDVSIPCNVQLATDLKSALSQADDILLAIPSNAFQEVVNKIKSLAGDKKFKIIIATKGLETQSGKLLHEIIIETFGENIEFAILSGPSFANEVGKNLPTTIVLSSFDLNIAKELRNYFQGGNFRVYINKDVIGTQLCAAIKNIIAIAVGISDGMGFGANARAALITRGLNEMANFIKEIGGELDTIYGLAGLGDMVLTCSDSQSRNRRFGLALGRGEKVDNAIKQIGQVVEGAKAAKTVYKIAKDKNLDMPICTQVYKVVYEGLPINYAVNNLFARQPTIDNINN